MHIKQVIRNRCFVSQTTTSQSPGCYLLSFTNRPNFSGCYLLSFTDQTSPEPWLLSVIIHKQTKLLRSSGCYLLSFTNKPNFSRALAVICYHSQTDQTFQHSGCYMLSFTNRSNFFSPGCYLLPITNRPNFSKPWLLPSIHKLTKIRVPNRVIILVVIYPLKLQS